uniref:Uncharacterized protein n=1 Tax=Cuerna arida TaxID=1464854 RepID=A0A1B6EI43_9HEMI
MITLINSLCVVPIGHGITLIGEFKTKGLKTLVCSPMGCVRDLVKPEVFAKNIVKFQNITGANVLVVSYNQRSHRILRNGLSHPEFLGKLRRCIDDCERVSSIGNQSAETLSNKHDNSVVLVPSTSITHPSNFPTSQSEEGTPIHCVVFQSVTGLHLSIHCVLFQSVTGLHLFS